MDFDTHGLGLKPVEDHPSFDASLLSSIIHDDNHPRDMTDWHFDAPDDLPVYDAQAQLPPGSVAVSKMWAQSDDPMHPRNLSRFFPDVDDNLLQRCMPVSKGKLWALVDADLYRALTVKTWQSLCLLQPDGTYMRYVRQGPSSKTTYLHREVFGLHLRRSPQDLKTEAERLGLDSTLPAEVLVPSLIKAAVVHHRNHDTEDNRLENLELIGQTGNLRQASLRASSTGFREVDRVKSDPPFRSRVRRFLHGQMVNLQVGRFDTADMAALARCLFLLVNPDLFVGGFTPSAGEQILWQNVVQLLHNGLAPDFGWQEKALPETVLVLLIKARECQKPTFRWRG